MKKRIISITLAVIAILIFLSSCKENVPETSTPNAPSTSPEATKVTEELKNDYILSSPVYVYNNFVFYQSANYDDPYRSTIKYQNLDNIQEQGIAIYSDSFGGEDPFTGICNIDILVDDEATENNGGLPILIISKSHTDINFTTGQKKSVSRIVRFDLGANKLTELFKSEGDMMIDGMCLYGDTLYFKSWSRDQKDKETYAYHSINKNGGKVTTYGYKEYVTSFKGIYNNTMYFFDSIGGKMISTDLSYNNAKTFLSNDSLKLSAVAPIMLPEISGSYMYYIDNDREIEVDGLKVKVGDIYRRSLDNYDDAKSELILEGVAKAYVSGNNIAYILGEDTKPYEHFYGPDNSLKLVLTKTPIVRSYSLKTKQTKIVVDNSMDTEKTDTYSFSGINGNYLIMTIRKPEDQYHSYGYYDIESGKASMLSFYSE